VIAFPPRVSCARLPTPLERSPRLGAELGIDLWYKRDDMTGLELSGNKARKLEFLLADALAAQADTVITCGGIQSNHCRAVAFAAARFGLRCVVLLRCDDPASPPPLEANALLDAVAGADIRYISHEAYADRKRVMAQTAAALISSGRRPYVIPEGGSNAIGAWGYVAAIAELRDQIPADVWNGPVTIGYATGSGGTAAGVEMGVRLFGGPLVRTIGFAVVNDAAYFRGVVAAICADASRADPDLPSVPAEAITIDDAFKGPGYARCGPEVHAMIRRAARSDGILIDPVYTAKAFLGFVTRLGEIPADRRGRAIFIHTGGAFGLFPFGAELLK
jgi:D-cysteine desulfhydrase